MSEDHNFVYTCNQCGEETRVGIEEAEPVRCFRCGSVCFSIRYDFGDERPVSMPSDSDHE